jgi:hypothetical protein
MKLEPTVQCRKGKAELAKGSSQEAQRRSNPKAKTQHQ